MGGRSRPARAGVKLQLLEPVDEAGPATAPPTRRPRGPRWPSTAARRRPRCRTRTGARRSPALLSSSRSRRRSSCGGRRPRRATSGQARARRRHRRRRRRSASGRGHRAATPVSDALGVVGFTDKAEAAGRHHGAPDGGRTGPTRRRPRTVSASSRPSARAWPTGTHADQPDRSPERSTDDGPKPPRGRHPPYRAAGCSRPPTRPRGGDDTSADLQIIPRSSSAIGETPTVPLCSRA